MATITRENIGLLNEKLSMTLSKDDYLPAFEKSLKEYSKKANIPGFRKGMVPSGLIKKMYGTSLFTDEILRSVDRELIKFLETEKLDIFAQPLPNEFNLEQLNVNSPADYHFSFEIGLKPAFTLPDLAKAKTIKYKITITDEMISSEIERLQNRYGNMKDEDVVSSDENVLNVLFHEVDENGNEIENGIKKDNSLLVKYFAPGVRETLIGKTKNDYIVIGLEKAFEEKERQWIIDDLGLDKNDAASVNKNFKIQITKIGLLEKRELNEDFFKQLYPAGDVATESEFRNKIKEEIALHWEAQARNQIHDQVYHELIDHTEIEVPAAFLKKWMKTQGGNGDGKKEKTEEEVEKEFPVFVNQLKWTLITDKIVMENNIQVTPDEIRNFAKQQLFGYMNLSAMDSEQPWVADYIEKMMKDRKYVEDAYSRIQTQKIFEWGEGQVNPTEKEISAEEFTKMVEEHKHHH